MQQHTALSIAKSMPSRNNPAWCPGIVNLESLYQLNTHWHFQASSCTRFNNLTHTRDFYCMLQFLLHFWNVPTEQLLKSNSYLLTPPCLTKLLLTNVIANSWQDILCRAGILRRYTTLRILLLQLPTLFPSPYVHRIRTFLRPFIHQNHWDVLPMALCNVQPKRTSTHRHMTLGIPKTWNVIVCIYHICGSTFSTEANDSWAVHTDSLQAQDESTIRIRE